MEAGFVGAILIKISFLAALAAAFFYFRNHYHQDSARVTIARSSYQLSTISLIAASAILLYLILTHQFKYTYVWNYSSTDLPITLLMSTFYAGQEGSFTVWALYISVIGLYLMYYSAKRGYESEVMSIYSLILSFFLLMLLVKSPFELIWNTFPNELIQTGPIPHGEQNVVILDAAKNIWARYPIEGRGLNPLLQNYWMIIHPQILLIGFAAMTVPYANAVAGLWRKDYTSWIVISTPWLVFGSLMLGAGIILGGYWAYETLGWGGFWGWDPVENSSLVPWLLGVAAIHTTLIQRKKGSYVRTNFFLNIMAFIAVLYSTFLTRSGVLGETSVHSFVDPGMWVYWFLLGCIALFASIGISLLAFRMREMPRVQATYSFFSREFALFLGILALSFVAIFVTIGTSAPIITTLMKGKASAVEMNYYIKTNLPLGIIIAFFSGLGQLLWWKSSKTQSLLRVIAVPTILALATTLVILLFGTDDFLIHLFTFCAAFSLYANLKIAYGLYKGNPKFIGGSLAHIGLAIMFLGFVTSEQYDQKRTLSLERGKSVEVFGYNLTYTGYQPIEREKFAFNVEVERNGAKHVVSPTMYFSEFTGGLMRHPDLLNFLTKDFYIAPLSLEEAKQENVQTLELTKGELTTFRGLRLTFEGFDLSKMDKSSAVERNAFTIGAKLAIQEEGLAAVQETHIRDGE